MSGSGNQAPFGRELINSDAGKEFLVVGLGASAGGISAGGIKAFREFFEHVPADSGTAYVVILPLSPDHDSQLAAVLQSAAAIPVTEVEDHVRVEPDHVYVIPPNKSLAIQDGRLSLSELRRAGERRGGPVSYALLHQQLLERYALPSVVVTEDFDVAHMSESAGRYMELRGGELSSNLLQLVRPELRMELRARPPSTTSACCRPSATSPASGRATPASRPSSTLPAWTACASRPRPRAPSTASRRRRSTTP